MSLQSKSAIATGNGKFIIENVTIAGKLLNNLRILRINSFYFDNYKNLIIFTEINLT